MNNTRHKDYSKFLVHNHPFITGGANAADVPMIRSLVWQSECESLLLLDQKIIPGSFGTSECKTYQQVSSCIKDMTVRGAPAIGVSAAYAMALASLQFANDNKDLILSNKSTCRVFTEYMDQARKTVEASRPTAVNLFWATKRMINVMNDLIRLSLSARDSISIQQVAQLMLNEAHAVCAQDIDICARIGSFGSSQLIKRGYSIMHHCNTGSLATVCGGTALSVVMKAFYDNKSISVYVNETRPRLQGSRLTAWELAHLNIEHRIVVDSCCAHLLSSGRVDCVIVGCDRVAINGDTANKIGTHTVATVAKQYNVPVYIACPVSTIDTECATGAQIKVEQRDINEIKQIGGVDVANMSSDCYNPAFDVTPCDFISAFITEYGICYPPFGQSLRRAVEQARQENEAKKQSRFKKYLTLFGQQPNRSRL